MTYNNPFVDFLRAYGPSASSDNMYDEHVTAAAERYGVEPLRIEAPYLEELVEHFKAPNPANIILTGTAGDGKTFLCRQVFEQLGGAREKWHTSGKVIDHELPGGGTLRIIKDLSELTDREKDAELRDIAAALYGSTDAPIYLIAANDGQLLKFWRTYARRHDEGEEIRCTLATMLNHERKDDPEKSLHLRMLNLSRLSPTRIFDELVDTIVEHPCWSTCDDCPHLTQCPIQVNRHLLRNDMPIPMRARLRDVVTLAAANDMHLPIRQLILLIVNILLGDAHSRGLLTCAKAIARHEDGRRESTNPFDNVVGLNLGPKTRKQYRAFTLFEQIGLGRETNNAIDTLLIEQEPADSAEAVELAEAYYGKPIFEALRGAYRRGENEDFDAVRRALESQRRRLFFLLQPREGERAGPYSLTPWNLTVFLHGGDYLQYQRMLADGTSNGRIESALIKGLNRTFTGTMTINDDALWLASPAGNSQSRLGRAIEGDPIPVGRGFFMVSVVFELDERHERPRISIRFKADDSLLASVDLRPLLFEYLMRVASGSLPATFSRQCFEELRHFRLRALTALRSKGLLGQEDGLDSLSLVRLSARARLELDGLGITERIR